MAGWLLNVRRWVRVAIALVIPWLLFSVYSQVAKGLADAVAPPFSAPAAAAERGLERLLLDSLVEPMPLTGSAVLSTRVVPADEIIPGRGAFYDSMREQGLATAVERTYGVREGEVRRAMVRLTYFAAERASESVTKPGQGTGVRLVEGLGTGVGWTEPLPDGARGEFHDGAVAAEFWLANEPGVKAEQRASELIALMRAQDQVLQPGPNLTDRTTISIRTGHWLGLALTVGFVFFALSLTQMMRWALRGSRQWLLPASTPASPVGIGDVSELARRLRRAALQGWILRTLVLCLVVGLLYEFSPGGTWGLGFGIAAVLLGWQIVSDRQAANRSSIPRPRSNGVAFVGQATAGAVSLTGLVMLATAFNADEIGGSQAPSQVAEAGVHDLIYTGGSLMLLGLVLQRMVLRLAMPSVAEALARDQRNPVLLLRSFKDDDLKMSITQSSQMSALERLNAVRTTFERALVWVLWQIGPVIAIGKPGTSLAPLGAAREYHGDETWQQAVSHHMRTARWVVFIVGDTWGWGWEVHEAERLGVLDKCLFVVPPVSQVEVWARTETLQSALDIELPPMLGGALLVKVPMDRGPEVMVARIPDDCSYRAAVLAATEPRGLTVGGARV